MYFNNKNFVENPNYLIIYAYKINVGNQYKFE